MHVHTEWVLKIPTSTWNSNFRDPLIKVQSFFFHLHFCCFFLSWFFLSWLFRCTVCDVLLACVLIINRECGCSYAHACAKQRLRVCLWTAFIYLFFLFSPQSWIYSVKFLLGVERGYTLPEALRILFSRWLSLLYVLPSLFRWGRAAVLP